MEPEYVIELFGQIPSKKNRYMPRRDRPGVFKSSKLQGALDSLALQVPAELVGLMLEHPDIELYVEGPSMRQDRDNILTTVLDVLVRMRVLKNDSAARCNGMIVLYPFRRSDQWRTVIKLKPSGRESRRFC